MALQSRAMEELCMDSASLSHKIARLVEEAGWNLEEFARRAGVNRLTVRQIVLEGRRRPRNATVSACAKALGLTVSDLRDQPLERLLPRVRLVLKSNGEAVLHRLYDHASQPELQAWLEQNPDRARQLTESEIDELLSLQGTGGPLTARGVQHFVDIIERKRKLVDKVNAIAGTEHLELLEKMVALLYEKVQPYRDRAVSGPET